MLGPEEVVPQERLSLEKIEDLHFHQEHRIYQDKIIYKTKMKQHLS